jgi:hypothetical protein
LVDRLDIFVFLIDIVFEAFADVFTQVSVNWGCWFIRINVVSEFVRGNIKGSPNHVMRPPRQ